MRTTVAKLQFHYKFVLPVLRFDLYQRRIRYNYYLSQRYQHADKIRVKRLRCLVHIIGAETPAGKVLTTDPDGGKRRGRSKTKCVNLVEADARLKKLKFFLHCVFKSVCVIITEINTNQILEDRYLLCSTKEKR